MQPIKYSSSRKFLRWAGSKSGVASRLESQLDFTLPYIEPFAGSSVIFFRNRPAMAALNDINTDLMNLYRDVKDDPDYVWSIYKSIGPSKDSYNEARQRFNLTRRSKLKSAIFMYLNHNCFNGIYRTNASGKFNTPFGGQRLGPSITKEQLRYVSERLQNVTLCSLDFETFINVINPIRSSVYMDPPYFTEEARVFREYGPGVFAKADLHRLERVCRSLSDRGNRVVVSYQDCSEFRDLFSDCIVDEIDVTRNVGGFRDRRKRQRELIAVMP